MAYGKGFISTRNSSYSGLPDKSFKSAGANVKTSRLNKGGDQNWRGKRGGAKKMAGYYSKDKSY